MAAVLVNATVHTPNTVPSTVSTTACNSDYASGNYFYNNGKVIAYLVLGTVTGTPTVTVVAQGDPFNQTQNLTSATLTSNTVIKLGPYHPAAFATAANLTYITYSADISSFAKLWVTQYAA